MGHQWTPGPEQGVIGLRLDHLCRHGPTRAAVVGLLTPPNANPLTIAQNIPGPGGDTINVFEDDISSFAIGLEQLTPGAAGRYRADARNLGPQNEDTAADRAAFKNFWLAAANNNPNLIKDMREKLKTALAATSKKVHFLWDCDLPGGSPPEVEHLELEQSFLVLFRTDDVPTP